jgi:nitric oxide reductase NorD protein
LGEPEGLLIEGTRLVAAGARDLWLRVRPPDEPAVLPLERVRHRLELLLRALHDQVVPILPADRSPAATWLARALGRAPRHLAQAQMLAGTDGECVWLPRTLDASTGEGAAIDRYRLFAVEQAERAVTGFARAWPHDGPLLERDLYRIAEAVAVDCALCRKLPGLAPALLAARAAALAGRTPAPRLTRAERSVEHLLQRVLAAELMSPPPELAAIHTPAAARAWARSEAQRLRSAGRYRGITPVALWGEPREPVAPPAPRDGDGSFPGPPTRQRSAALRRPPRARRGPPDDDDTAQGLWMVRFDDPMESVEDPRGLKRPPDQDGSADPGELAEALSELPVASIVRAFGAPPEVLQTDTQMLAGAAGLPVARDGMDGITYPEWDHGLGAYRFPGAMVRPASAPAGNAAWVENALARHATLVRQIRRRFDVLRPHRARRARQPDGDELDIAAYVDAFGDRRANAAGDDRLYTALRPARRDLALLVLADVSASTDAWVEGGRRVVDVEKEALVVLLEAMHVLGDRHAVLAFSGQGPRAVHVLSVKAFDDARAIAQRRIAALEPDGYTRLGTALRHACVVLGREPARHRLLLVLSDGKPNDTDEYAGRYGIEDTRQAVAEARMQGLTAFCLTVDRQAPAYMPAIFGRRGFAVLPRPALLPAVLAEVLRSLVAS